MSAQYKMLTYKSKKIPNDKKSVDILYISLAASPIIHFFIDKMQTEVEEMYSMSISYEGWERIIS